MKETSLTATPLEDAEADAQAESAVAREAGRRLASYAGRRDGLRVQVVAGGDAVGEAVALPPAALRPLVDILNALATGDAVTVLPTAAELTTQQAADLLLVSRPYLVRLLDDGRIPHRRVGTHRRVSLRALLVYKTQLDADRRDALAELTAQAQELGMGY